MKYGYDCWVVRMRRKQKTHATRVEITGMLFQRWHGSERNQGLFIYMNDDSDRLLHEIIHLANMYRVLTLRITYYYVCDVYWLRVISQKPTTYQLNASVPITHQAHQLRMIERRHKRIIYQMHRAASRLLVIIPIVNHWSV